MLQTGEQVSSYSVPAAVRVARIVKLLAREPMEHRMVDIARILEMNVSTCHNILRTLRDEGLVSYDPVRKVYGIGVPTVASFRRLIDIGWGIYPAVPTMQALSDELAMTAILGDARSGREMSILTTTYPNNLMSLSMSEFDTVPLLAGSMGQIVAAGGALAEGALPGLFAESSHERDYRFADFMAGVEAARRQGWAVDDGGWQRGIWGISTAVPNAANTVERVLCLVCASGSVTPGQVGDVAQTLLRAARKIAAEAF